MFIEKSKPFHLILWCIISLIFLNFNLIANPKLKKIDEVLSKRCLDCHDEDLKKGKIQLDDPNLLNAELLSKVFKAVRGGHMPPAKKKPIAPIEQANLLNAIANQLQKQKPKHVRRMTKTELIYSLEDLLGIKLKTAIKNMISDEQVDHGFDVTSDLGLSEHHLKSYLNVIQAALDQALQIKKPIKETMISPKFIYDSHPKRPKIKVGGPITVIQHQPRTANGTEFPYFRNKFVCREDGLYEIEFTVEPNSPQATLMLFAGVHYADGALVFERPQLLNNFYINGKRTIKAIAHLKPTDQIGFSALIGTSFKLHNPVKIHGPLHTHWPSKKIQSALKPAVLKTSEQTYQLKKQTINTLTQCLDNFANMALRKSKRSKSIQAYHKVSQEHFKNSGNWLKSLKVGLSSMLCSPEFLLIDSRKDNDIRLAEHMSFMLWKSLPDTKLLNLARQRKLHHDKVFKTTSQRMIRDPKAKRFIRDFSNQWLHLNEIKRLTADYRLYPEYDLYLRESMIQESYHTVQYYIENDIPLREMVHSDYIFLNEKLALHYNIPKVKGTHFRKVTLNKKSTRGGILTQASLMMATADGVATTPVKRGLWMMEQFLNRYVPAPPEEVPGIESDITGKKTILEQLAVHRNKKECRSCHTAIDPYGVAFERFDPIGGERKHYRKLRKYNKNSTITFGRGAKRYQKGEIVIADYKMPDGRLYKDIHGFKEEILKQMDRVYMSMTEKLLSYAKGRKLNYSERLIADDLAKQAMQKELGFQDLIYHILSSSVFKDAS